MASGASNVEQTATVEGQRRPADQQADLRRDIRELGALLGRTLVRQEGPELLELVERVRRLIRTDRDAAATLLGDVDTGSAIQLVRAFTAYFHLANVAEQVHRGRELAVRRADCGSWLTQALACVSAAGLSASELAAGIRNLTVRLVFTAHPTEAARRSVLEKLRRVADVLDDGGRSFGSDGIGTAPVTVRRKQRRLEELIELLWQTDEHRIARPDVVDEARNAVYYF